MVIPRELTESECLQALCGHTVGRIAMCTPQGPRVFPVNYVVDDGSLVIRTSPYGTIASEGGRNAEVAFEVVDRAQGLGLGRLLLDVVGTAACDVGVTTLLWTMDPHNLRIRQLAMPLGGQFEMDEDVLEGHTPLPVLPTVDACRVIRCARLARRAAARRHAA